MWLTGPVAPRHVGSSQTRARTRVPCIGRQILNHCATREARAFILESSKGSHIYPTCLQSISKLTFLLDFLNAKFLPYFIPIENKRLPQNWKSFSLSFKFKMQGSGIFLLSPHLPVFVTDLTYELIYDAAFMLINISKRNLALPPACSGIVSFGKMSLIPHLHSPFPQLDAPRFCQSIP